MALHLKETPEEIIAIRRDLGEAVNDAVRRILEYCAKHPDECFPVFVDCDIDKWPPNGDPVESLGHSVIQHVSNMLARNTVDPVGNVHAQTGTWNIKENPAVYVIQSVLSKKQRAQIAANRLEQNIKINEQTIAIQKMMLDMVQNVEL
jgi:hypothetical protein